MLDLLVLTIYSYIDIWFNPFFHENQWDGELFGVNILSMAMPKRPLRVNKIIDDTPSEDIATRMITVDRTNPVFLARLPKSV